MGTNVMLSEGAHVITSIDALVPVPATEAGGSARRPAGRHGGRPFDGRLRARAYSRPCGPLVCRGAFGIVRVLELHASGCAA
ncbi:hypothetical protein, partial [Microbacterium aurantiacum]|uniref:hypothetical protein n=1 Tax=Microbacterium aurantiacum TaxID=162393 RepID=UPI0031D1CE07